MHRVRQSCFGLPSLARGILSRHGLDEIIIDALPVSARIGVTAEERSCPQPLVVHMKIFKDLRCCGRSDKIRDTISYASLQKSIASHCYETFNTVGIKTIECLAHQLARIAIVGHGSTKVSVRIDKPGAIRWKDFRFGSPYSRSARGASVVIERDIHDFEEAVSFGPDSSASSKSAFILGLGSNLGDRAENISKALKEIKSRFEQMGFVPTSFMYETAPVINEDQPNFLNCACKIFTEKPPLEILKICKGIERDLGRDLTATAKRYGPRTIDIDILLSDDNSSIALSDPNLVIPHPALAQRLFALAPVCDIDPSLLTPSGKTVSQLSAALRRHSPDSSRLGIEKVLCVKRQGKMLSLERAVVMGIVNVTPDSFADSHQLWGRDGQAAGERTERAVSLALDMLRIGAKVIDVGGCSTRPGAKIVTAEEEMSRVIPVIQRLRERDAEAVISIDTIRGSVATQALAAGASIINDVSAGTAWGIEGESTLPVAAVHGVPIVLSHNRGVPETMSENLQYDNVVEEVVAYLRARIEAASAAGVARYNLIVDPGIGFGKDGALNMRILRSLDSITAAKELLGVPFLIGISRKKFIGKIVAEGRGLGVDEVVPPEDRSVCSAVAAAFATFKGVQIVRVHDVAETLDAVSFVTKLRKIHE